MKRNVTVPVPTGSYRLHGWEIECWRSIDRSNGFWRVRRGYTVGGTYASLADAVAAVRAVTGLAVAA